MKCIYGTFFDVNGAVGDTEQIKAEIYHKISPYVTSNIAKKATSLLDVLRIRSYSPPIPFQTDRIHVANGTYFLSKNFSAQKDFCMNRLPVRYLPDAPKPLRWLAFLGQLLEPEDIITLQEFMGYVLLPTTKGQKMMIVIGKGGNGNLGSLYDRSYGFFRRQIVLTVKEREPDRKDDPFLGEKLLKTKAFVTSIVCETFIFFHQNHVADRACLRC